MSSDCAPELPPNQPTRSPSKTMHGDPFLWVAADSRFAGKPCERIASTLCRLEFGRWWPNLERAYAPRRQRSVIAQRLLFISTQTHQPVRFNRAAVFSDARRQLELRGSPTQQVPHDFQTRPAAPRNNS